MWKVFPLGSELVVNGRSCLLHRFIKDEWKALSSHTIGVEFANKIIKLGTGVRRKRMKLQVFPPKGVDVDGD
jgi:Ras-related protein Rab-4B